MLSVIVPYERSLVTMSPPRNLTPAGGGGRLDKENAPLAPLILNCDLVQDSYTRERLQTAIAGRLMTGVKVKTTKLDNFARKHRTAFPAVIFAVSWIIWSCAIRSMRHRPIDFDVLIGAVTGGAVIAVGVALIIKLRNERSK